MNEQMNVRQRFCKIMQWIDSDNSMKKTDISTSQKKKVLC